MVGSWKRLLLQWLVGLILMFAGSHLVFGLGEGSFDVRRAAFFAFFWSTLCVLPAVLSRLVPIGGKGESRHDVASGNTSWLCYACLLEGLAGVVVAAVSLAWGWRVLGLAAALIGFALAYGIWKGHVQFTIRQ